MSCQYSRIAAIPLAGVLNGVSTKVASGVNTARTASTSPRSHATPNVSTSRRYASVMAANIAESRTRHSNNKESCMRQRIFASVAALVFAVLPLRLAAQAAHATAGTQATITGQVIDLNCHTTMGASGA